MRLNVLGVRQGQRAMVYGSLLFLVIFYGGFRLWPMAYSIVLSLFNWRGLKPIWEQQFVGLSHYEFALVKDTLVLESLWRTIVFSAELVVISTVLGLIVAVLIRNHRRAQPALRLAYFLPYIVPAVVSGLLMRVLFQPQFGSVNALLNIIGLPSQPWMASPKSALLTVALVAAWARLGYNVILFLAGLDQIPSDLLDAARVDGAGAWQTFWRITFPLLMPVMLFVVVTGTIAALQEFGVIYAMTLGSTEVVGGPVRATTVFSILLYLTAFSEVGGFNYSYGATLAVILFLLIFGLTLVQFRVMRTRWEY